MPNTHNFSYHATFFSFSKIKVHPRNEIQLIKKKSLMIGVWTVNTILGHKPFGPNAKIPREMFYIYRISHNISILLNIGAPSLWDQEYILYFELKYAKSTNCHLKQ